ncbi:MAG: GtrA family protein [Clostridia bacterium]|nr:GtrA family protein [Clostridia bacterium]
MKEEIKAILKSGKSTKEKLRDLLKYAEAGKLAPFVQFVKFGLVGVSNTAIQYFVNLFGHEVLFRSLPEPWRSGLSIALGFILSVINSYFWNNRYVFKSDVKKAPGEHVKAFVKMTASYALTSLLLTWLVTAWIYGKGVPYWIAALIPLVVTVPLNFFMNKYLVFKEKKQVEKANPEGGAE